MAAEDTADSSRRVPVTRVGSRPKTQAQANDTDFVAIEEPLEIRLTSGSGEERATHAVAITMRTPGDDANLAAGFLLTEGIIADKTAIAEVTTIREREHDTINPNLILVELEPEIEVDIGSLQRNFYTTSSCGVCGKASLEALSAQASVPVNGNKLDIDAQLLTELPGRLIQRQATFSATGGLHAAGLFAGTGKILDVREDVGRHNAVDKLIGNALLQGHLPLWNQGVILSGRASFEIMQKLRMAGCPLVAAVGAPSSLAVEVAWEFDMTLVGFLRDGRFNIYSNPNRINQA